jgi:hypothetical protein
MDQGLGLGLCQPATAIVVVAIAGMLFHLLAGHGASVLWWLMVGVFGGGIFQALCRGGLEPVAWILMLIPVLIVCFFLAVALFAARMRIQNVQEVPCGRCGHARPCGCQPVEPPRPRCNRTPCGGGDCPPPCLLGGGAPAVGEGFAQSGNGSGLTQAYGSAIGEGFTTKEGACGCQACGCIGGPCPGCGRAGQSSCLSCGGAGCPYCAYASQVATEPWTHPASYFRG